MVHRFHKSGMINIQTKLVEGGGRAQRMRRILLQLAEFDLDIVLGLMEHRSRLSSVDLSGIETRVRRGGRRDICRLRVGHVG